MTSSGAVGDGPSPSSESPSDALLRELADTGEAPPHAERAPGDRVGRFRVESVLGRGGMGVVYGAIDEELGRRVALKLLHARHVGHDDRRRRFLREARAAAAIDHARVARLLEVGEDGDDVFLVFERVDGETLRAHVRGRRLEMREIAHLGSQICDALSAAHAASVVHRDLKPDNAIVTAGRDLKVLDFGLARRAAREGETQEVVTMEGQILGSPGYMAPEQFLGAETGPAADVFSLGVVLYELAAGRRPFDGHGAMETLVSTTRDEAPALSRARPDLPRAFTALVMRCLAKAPDARPTLGEISAVLARAGAAPRRRRAPIAIAIAVVGVAGLTAAVLPRRAPHVATAEPPAPIVPVAPIESARPSDPPPSPVVSVNAPTASGPPRRLPSTTSRHASAPATASTPPRAPSARIDDAPSFRERK